MVFLLWLNSTVTRYRGESLAFTYMWYNCRRPIEKTERRKHGKRVPPAAASMLELDRQEMKRPRAGRCLKIKRDLKDLEGVTTG